MERQQLIGLLLLIAFVLLWALWQAPRQRPVKQLEKPQPKDALVKPDTLLPPKPQKKITKTSYGPFDSVINPHNHRYWRIQTNTMSIQLRSKGGVLVPLHLKTYKTYHKDPAKRKPLPLVPQNTAWYLQFPFQGKLVSTKNFQFDLVSPLPKKWEKDSLEVRLRATITPQRFIEYRYTFYKNAYHVRWEVRFHGLQDWVPIPNYEVVQRLPVVKTEKDAEVMRRHTTVFYRYGGDVEALEGGDEPTKKEVQGKITWICLKSQFFNVTIIPEQPFEYATLEEIPYKHPDSVKLLSYWAQARLKYKNPKEGISRFLLYMGPNDYYILSRYKQDLESIIPLGVAPMRWINRYIILPVFKFLERYIGNYGLIILILTILIKILLWPLTYRSYLSMAKMQIVNKLPEMKQLEQRYKDDPQQLQVQKMMFYRRLGINPMGGCIPQLLQFPVLFAMFYFFPASIELRQKSFLWADDLSAYDAILELPFHIPLYGSHVSLFTLLMAISVGLYSYFNYKQQGMSVEGPNPGKWMLFLSPILLLVFLNRYSSGLSYYYLCANLITMLQSAVIKRFFIDEQRLIAQLRQQMKQRKGKKSRLERWVMQQQRRR